MTEKPRTFAVSRFEGSAWEPFVHRPTPPDREGWKVHSIMFDDGSVWDACNGWRVANPEYPAATVEDVRAAWARQGIAA